MLINNTLRGCVYRMMDKGMKQKGYFQRVKMPALFQLSS